MFFKHIKVTNIQRKLKINSGTDHPK